MAAIGIEVLIVLLLVIGNGILAMSEMAVVSARKIRLKQRADTGDAGARVALELVNSPNRFLSTVQIGITLVGILAGTFGGATISEQLAERLRDVPALAPYSNAIGIAVVVIAITYLSLIIGELVPKRLALQNPEGIASRMARPMRVLSIVARPFVALLSISTETVLRLLGARPSTEPPVTEEEVTMMIQQGTDAGIFELAEQEMVASVFRLGDRRAGELLTPRRKIVWLDIDDPLSESQQAMAASPHIYFPVCQGDLDQVIGIVSVKDLWTRSQSGEGMDLRVTMTQPLFVPENMPVLRVLEMFKQSGMHMALVVDEFGGVQGLFTLNDVLEALVGDIPMPNSVHEQPVVKRDDGSWLLDGLLPVDEVKELLNIKMLPREREGYYHTLAGFVMMQLGQLPRVADNFDWGGFRFEVVDMDAQRIDRLLVSPLDARQHNAGVE